MSVSFALVGKRHSGKGSLSNFLVQNHGYERFAFADPLKDLWVDMYNVFLDRIGFPADFTREQLNREKEFHRVDLERLGSVHGRGKDDECWVRLAKELVDHKREISAQEGGSIAFVGDDVRFLNEVEALRDRGFIVVKLVRDEDERIHSVRQSLKVQWDMRHTDDPTKPMLLTPAEDKARWDWVDEELEKTRNLPSEVEVDRIVADISVANTTLDALERTAAVMAR